MCAFTIVYGFWVWLCVWFPFLCDSRLLRFFHLRPNFKYISNAHSFIWWSIKFLKVLSSNCCLPSRLYSHFLQTYKSSPILLSVSASVSLSLSLSVTHFSLSHSLFSSFPSFLQHSCFFLHIYTRTSSVYTMLSYNINNLCLWNIDIFNIERQFIYLKITNTRLYIWSLDLKKQRSNFTVIVRLKSKEVASPQGRCKIRNGNKYQETDGLSKVCWFYMEIKILN